MDAIPIQDWPTDSCLRRQRLAEALQPDRLSLLRTVAEEADRHGLKLYLVGGFVRDLLLGRPATDFDLVVEGDAAALAHALERKFGGKVTVHMRFGTAKWHLTGSSIKGIDDPDSSMPHFLDFISARKETYPHPGALPVVQSGSLADDLQRRDFSINTLALRLDGDHFGDLRDDLNGLEDLKHGEIRALHPLSYMDDPTRILRAVRYEQRYGFRITSPDLKYIAAARSLLAGISGDRIRHELNLVLAEENGARVLARLNELGLIGFIHPKLPWDDHLRRRLESGLMSRPPKKWGHLPAPARIPKRVSLGYLLWLMDLSSEEIGEITSRLRFPASLREHLLAASRLKSDLTQIVKSRPSAVVARIEGVPSLSIYALYLISGKECQEMLHRYMVDWRHVIVATTGEDLKRRGVAPGPAYQVILRRLHQAWLDGEVKTIQEEQSLLEELVRSLANDG